MSDERISMSDSIEKIAAQMEMVYGVMDPWAFRLRAIAAQMEKERAFVEAAKDAALYWDTLTAGRSIDEWEFNSKQLAPPITRRLLAAYRALREQP